MRDRLTALGFAEIEVIDDDLGRSAAGGVQRAGFERIENMFGRLKDWRRIHTRYDRCAHTYFSAICIAAAVIFWL